MAQIGIFGARSHQLTMNSIHHLSTYWLWYYHRDLLQARVGLQTIQNNQVEAPSIHWVILCMHHAVCRIVKTPNESKLETSLHCFFEADARNFLSGLKNAIAHQVSKSVRSFCLSPLKYILF